MKHIHKINRNNAFFCAIFGLFLIISGCSPEEKEVCCTVADIKDMKVFTSDTEFRAMHELPSTISNFKKSGKNITFEASDGKKANAYFLKAKKKTNHWLFVIHEWWGLNDHIRQEAEKLQKDLGNVHVIALDLYDGNVATSRDDAAKFMKAVKEERAEAIIQGAVKYAGEEAKIMTIGWCFGGGWSLKSTILAQKQSAGCVIYYGMPISDVEKLKTLNTDVLGIFASKEKWISPQVVADFQVNMTKADKKVTVHSFSADHAFANPSSPRYHQESAQKAYQITLDYLKDKMK